MARIIELVATTQGSHYLIFGFSSSELATFSLQLYITKYGKRAIDWLQAMSLGFVSFSGGNVYLHNDDSVPRANLFGEQKDKKFGLVINEQATTTKILDSIGIYTDGNWEVESVTIPPDFNYPDGMFSRIPSSYFKKREGVLYSNFLRNGKTSSSVVKQSELLSGEPLRSNEAYVVIKHIGTAETQVWKVDCQCTASR